MKRFSALLMLSIFTIAVMLSSHSYADNNYKTPIKGGAVKAKVFGMDKLFVCTADFAYVSLTPRVPYAPAKDVIVVAPIKLVAATGNSPPSYR